MPRPDVATEAFNAVRALLGLLREGVTAVRDPGHDDHVHMQLRDVINNGVIFGPRMKVAGVALGMSWGHAHFVVQQIHSHDEAVAEVRRQISSGADFIKIIVSNEDVAGLKGDRISVPWFDGDTLKKCVEIAHQCGLPVAVHASGSEAIDMVIDARVNCIEHAICLTREQARKMKDRNIFYVPTMSGSCENTDPKWGRGSAWRERFVRLWSYHVESVSNAIKEGVVIATGTDTLGKVPDEMNHFTKAGMTNYDAVKAATFNGAKVMEMENHIGSLEAGKFADMVMLNGDPLVDLNALNCIEQVVKAGTPISMGELQKFMPYSPQFALE